MVISTNPVLVNAASILIMKSAHVKSFEENASGFTVKNDKGAVLVEGTDIRDALQWYAANNYNLVVNLPLCGKYYLTIRTITQGKYIKFDVKLRSCDKRKNTCVMIDDYNVMEGYWYTPEYKLSKAAKKALHGYKYRNLITVLRMFNKDFD